MLTTVRDRRPFVLSFIALALVAVGVLAWQVWPLRGEAGVLPACADSFARWQGLAGHWEGTYMNQTFGSSGDVAVDAVINDDCTGQATVEGIFNQTQPHTIFATYRDDVTGTVVEVQDDPIFGDATVNLTAAGVLTLEATGLHQNIERVTGTGTLSTEQLLLEIILTLQGGSTATETIELTHEITATPTPTATPSITPTPTATPAGLTQGDVDCSGAVNSVDALKELRHVADLPVSQPPGCPEIGSDVASLWGDVDCNDRVDSVDALKVLRHIVDLPVTQEPGCPPIGSPV